MPVTPVEHTSSHGDQSVGQVQFVLHRTANATESADLPNGGLRFIEGKPAVSTDLGKAVRDAEGGTSLGEPGDVFVMAVPANFHVGYGVFTSAFVDRSAKQVSGAPARYADARSHLALYLSSDTEERRVHIEAEAANGYGLEQHPQQTLDRSFLIGRLAKGEHLNALVKHIEVGIGELNPPVIESLEGSMREVFVPLRRMDEVLMPSVISSLVCGAIEAAVISKLRWMRWGGLALLGYQLVEDDFPVQIKAPAGIENQKAEILQWYKVFTDSPLFEGELAWLRTYGSQQLSMMRVEMDSAKLLSE